MSRRLRRQTVKNNPVWSKSQDPRIVFNSKFDWAEEFFLKYHLSIEVSWSQFKGDSAFKEYLIYWRYGHHWAGKAALLNCRISRTLHVDEIKIKLTNINMNNFTFPHREEGLQLHFTLKIVLYMVVSLVAVLSVIANVLEIKNFLRTQSPKQHQLLHH